MKPRNGTFKFTDAKLRSLKPGKDRYEVWELNGAGFGLRVMSSGVKSFVSRYRYGGKSRIMTYGKFPALGLADAHDLHRKAYKLLLDGMDPGTAKATEKVAIRNSVSLKELADLYILEAKIAKKSWIQDQGILNRDILPPLGNMKAADVNKRDVLALLDKVVQRGSPVMANRIKTLISTMYTFGLSRDLVEANPCLYVSKPFKESSRQRALSAEEIKVFWYVLPDCQLSQPVQLGLKFLLVTLQRRTEATHSRWENIDLPSRWWTIPAESTKNGLSHRVYLNDTAMTLLSAIKEYSGDSPFLFPSPQKGPVKPLQPSAFTKAVSRKQDIFGLSPFTPHDLRRTAATQMTQNGISRETVNQILNHVEGGVINVYDRGSYDKSKRLAMIKWDEILSKILSG